MMKPFHHEQFPVHGIVELINQRGRLWNVSILKQDVPSRLFPRDPFPYPRPILFSRQMRHLLYESSQPLRKRPVVRGFTCAVDEKDLPKLSTKRSAHGFGHLFDLAG